MFERCRARLLAFFSRDRGRQRFSEEMESHLALQAADNLRAGMSLAEANRQARLKFGGAAAIAEQYHAVRGLPALETFLQDVRYALRGLRNAPVFTLVAVITLMLGMGANFVVFSVANEVLLHPLAVSDPASLYQVRHQQWMMGRLITTSYPAFEDYRRRNTTFVGIAGINAYSRVILRWHNVVMSLAGSSVTSNYFDLLGVRPQLGRFFHEADEHGVKSVPYVVLSNAMWRNVFHGDPSIIGTTVQFDDQPLTVIGVAPALFHGTERFAWPDYWIPLTNQAQSLQDRKDVSVTVIGRLKPGVTQQQATDNLNAIAAQLAREYPSTDDGQPLRLIHPGLIGDEGDVIRGFLWSVSLLALLVLAAACANLASLFAARTADRSRELAVRVALGSSRRRMMRQLLTEATILSLLGGIAALVITRLSLAALNRLPAFVDSHLLVAMDARVYLVALALTVVSAVLLGLLPARQGWQSSPLQMMKATPASDATFRRFAMRDVLLGLQITICTLLVLASLVAVRGMQRMLQTPLGFSPHGALLAEIDLNKSHFKPAAPAQQVQQALEVIRSVPGVASASLVSHTPLTGGIHNVPIFQPGVTDYTLKNAALASYVIAMSPGYLETAATRLLSGRDITWQDTTPTPHVAIVNQTFAAKMWPRQTAIGQHFQVDGVLTEVIGVAEDGKYHDLQEPPQPVIYQPLAQDEGDGYKFVVRSRRSASEMAGVLAHTLGAMEPELSISVRNWSEDVEEALFPGRVAAIALGVMGLLSAMLAITGIFGMAAYTVSRRLKELGIRMALGARKPQVLHAALGRPLALLGVGSLAGLCAGIAAGRLLEKIVYQANPRDPQVVCGAVLTMALLGIAASAIPAWKAIAIDPAKLMRED